MAYVELQAKFKDAAARRLDAFVTVRRGHVDRIETWIYIHLWIHGYSVHLQYRLHISSHTWHMYMYYYRVDLLSGSAANLYAHPSVPTQSQRLIHCALLVGPSETVAAQAHEARGDAHVGQGRALVGPTRRISDFELRTFGLRAF